MSCYFRHMKEIFEEAGITVNPDNKRELDRTFHHIVGIEYKDCPATWKAIKQNILSDDKKRADLIQKLRAVALQK